MNNYLQFNIFLKFLLKINNDYHYVFVNAMRSVAAQTIHNAKQGHTGMAMSSAPIIYSLYISSMNISNVDSKWIDRDRMVLSAGHGSAILYSLFYLSKLISLNDLQNFRKKNSITPGHPEYEKNNFIDASTGPLGQGVANAVGMAIAEKYMNNRWKKLKLIDHYTYVVAGDGDLQEGICYEAMSLAGKLNLNKLVLLHDSNDYQLDSAVSDVFNENLKKRCESCNWNYIKVSSLPTEIINALEIAKKSSKPTFIEVKTIIGEGTSKASNYKAHGLSITDDELKNINNYFKMNYKNWEFPSEIFDYFEKNVVIRGKEKYNKWISLTDLLSDEPDYKLFLKRVNGNFNDVVELINSKTISKTNQPTKTYLKEYFDSLEECKDILTLSADLASTTNCKIGKTDFSKDINSGYVMAGIREFSMSAIQNGILLHKGLQCFSGTFLSFVDYQKSAIRVGALSNLNSNYILTHDSYLVGGDGPTHQPYDQLPMLRAIENVYTWRPIDEIELESILKHTFMNDGLTNCIVLTRQPTISGLNTKKDKTILGAYEIFNENPKDVDICLIASGSEVGLAIDSVKYLKENMNINIKIISAPSIKTFLEQDEEYIKSTIKSNFGVLCIEASSDYIWYKLNKYTNKNVEILGAYTFGKSMDGKILYSDKGFNKENILKKCKDLING